MKHINKYRFTLHNHLICLFFLPQSTRNEQWASSPVWQTHQPWESSHYRWLCCPDHTPHWQSISEKEDYVFFFFYIFLLTISIVISMPKILHDAISAECTNWHRHHLQSKAGLLPGFQLPCGAGPDSCAASVGLHDHILDSLTPPTPLGTGALPPQLDYPNLEIQVQIQIQCDGKSTINLLCVNCFSLL